MFHSFKIDGYKIDCEKVLGKGQYGVVVECKSESEYECHEQLCAKLIDVTDSTSAQREADILNFLAQQEQSNQNIVHVKKVVYYQKKRLMGVVMERCQTNLQAEIEKKKVYSENQVIEFFKQILNGYKLLEENNIIHRDLKPENILINFLNDKPIYKIADFGVGKIYEENEISMTKAKGTPAYAPPEINCLHQEFDNETDDQQELCYNKSSVDIYSIGLILHKILYGKFPFQVSENGIKEFLEHLKLNPFKVSKKSDRNSFLSDIIEKMIVYLPSKRITFSELYNLLEVVKSDSKKIDNLESSAGSNSNQFFSTAETQPQVEKKNVEQQPPFRGSNLPQNYVQTFPINRFSTTFTQVKFIQPQQSVPQIQQKPDQAQFFYQSVPNKNFNPPAQWNPTQLQFQQQFSPQQNYFQIQSINNQNTQELFEELKETLRFLSDLQGLTTKEAELRQCLSMLNATQFNDQLQIQKTLQNIKAYFVFESQRNYSKGFIRFLFIFYYFAYGKQVQDLKKLDTQQQRAYLTSWQQ